VIKKMNKETTLTLNDIKKAIEILDQNKIDPFAKLMDIKITSHQRDLCNMLIYSCKVNKIPIEISENNQITEIFNIPVYIDSDLDVGEWTLKYE